MRGQSGRMEFNTPSLYAVTVVHKLRCIPCHSLRQPYSVIWRLTFCGVKEGKYRCLMQSLQVNLMRIGVWGSVVVKALRYKSDGPEIDSRWCQYFLPTVPWSWGSTQPIVKMSTRNIPGGEGGRCVRLTTSPPSCAECHEILEPKPPGTLWDRPGLLRDS
jgi:hypothetical protein